MGRQRSIVDWAKLDEYEIKIAKFAGFICKRYAYETAKTLGKEYETAIQRFYNDYPESDRYYRGYGLGKTYKTFYKSYYGTTYYGGIIISSSLLQYTYKDSKGTDYVWHGAVDLGYHGTSHVKVTKPSAKRQVINKKKYIEKHYMDMYKHILNDALEKEFKDLF